MSSPAAKNSSSDVEQTAVVQFVNLALSQNDRTGICRILEEIAKNTRSAGGILWELDPAFPLTHPDARLFTAGHWFRNLRRFAEHSLSVKHSFMGWVLNAGGTHFTNSATTDDRCSHSQAALEFYNKHDIDKFLAAPVRFVDNTLGVLAVFRGAHEPAFEEQDKPLLEMYCSLLPGLHHSLHNKVSFNLVNQVKDILQDADESLDDLHQFWQQICSTIQRCFHLIEVSLFLEDRDREFGEFHLRGTTYEDYVSQKMYRAGEKSKTSWAITNRKDVCIWDLKHRNEKKELDLIQNKHPRISWDPDIDIEAVAAKAMDCPVRALPPLSFIAQPIFSSKANLRGILRCFAAREAPYYFTHRERALLAVVASQIGQFWSKWLDRRTIRDENATWIRVAESMKKLNYSVGRELKLNKKSLPDVQNVLRKGLDEVTALLPGWEITDICLLDKDSDELHFAHTLPRDENIWTKEKKAMRLSTHAEPGKSITLMAFKSQAVKSFVGNSDQPHFPGVKSIIAAPIVYRENCYGVIDLRNVHNHLPIYAEQIAELFGRQFGLFYGLIDVHKTLKEQAEITGQAFADWRHQIQGPISQAYFRLRQAIRSQFPEYSKVPQYLKIQIGLLTKAKRAAQALRLFLELAGKEKLQGEPVPMDTSDVGKLMLQTCQDNQILWHRKRQVEFDVDLGSFDALQPHAFLADPDLLEQAVNNIIDNAFKYSYRQTLIKVSASDNNQHFCLSVSNEGIPVEKPDIPELTRRGWRGENAKRVQGEGTGIGLWVVDHIMKAHDGRLEIAPTVNGRTVVRLFFPWNR